MIKTEGDAIPTQYTSIAGRRVPVAPGPRTAIRFSGACHPNDPPGLYEFWSVENESGPPITGRCRAGRDPGERFRMAENQPGHEAFRVHIKSAVLVRPASEAELRSWLNSHRVEAPCAGSGQIGGRKVRIETDPNGSSVVRAYD